MGQAPGKGKISLRTMPRNFPGRSGTLDDQVYLCSPETAVASALSGKITDPRDLPKLFRIPYSKYRHPKKEIINLPLLFAPDKHNARKKLEKGENIKALPRFTALKKDIYAPVILKMGDGISTDEILRGGSKVLPLRSNIPAISKWLYHQLDTDFYSKAQEAKQHYGGHIVVAGHNYAQGSSREHAALAPKYLGQLIVIAKSYARIGWQNLINYGILPLSFENEKDFDLISSGDILSISGLDFNSLMENKLIIQEESKHKKIKMMHRLSERQIQIVLAGGMINFFNNKGNK
jgi:aconitate hydratase